MRAVVQRVRSASVSVSEEIVGRIGAGLCAFIGVTHQDDKAAAKKLAEKIWNLRIFEDSQGRINRSARELGLPVLVVSQFTLYADTSRGRRPSLVAAAPPEVAEPLVEHVIAVLRGLGARVESGCFGRTMEVVAVNDGPFTVLLEA
jgi:D-aminoacyl-tRNA deacylase